MSYLVLARKYRPQRFSELVGQEHVARTLSNAIAQDRVHHAFLFTGARGVGKTSAARILAKSLCCVQGPTIEPCGVCDPCREIAQGRSVDIVEIDGASNTGVDDVRTLREGARYLPSQARLKIYIIDEVHMLSTSAFNALLKTLEEPPAHVVFIFATTEVHKIPATILSRCQRYDFKLIPTARLAAHLEGILATEKLEFEPAAVRLVARQAAGSVRDALSLLDQVIAYVGTGRLEATVVSDVLGIADRRLLVELSRAVLGRDVATTLRAMASAVDRGIDLAQLAQAFLGMLRDLELAWRVSDATVLEQLIDATPDELAELRALAAGASVGGTGETQSSSPAQPPTGDLFTVLFDRWARAVDESSKAQTPQLILEMALVDLCQAEPLEPLGDLLVRLESLERRLLARGGGGGGEGEEGVGGGKKVARSPGGSGPGGGGGAGSSYPGAQIGAQIGAQTGNGAIGGGHGGGHAPASVRAHENGAGAATVAEAVRVAREGVPPSAMAGGIARPPSVPVSSSSSSSTSVLTEAAPAPASVSPHASVSPTESWRRVRQDLERRRPRIGALLASAHLLEADATKVVLGFADRTDAESAERARGDIEVALLAEWGSPVRFHVKHEPGATVGALVRAESVEEGELRATERRNREDEARQHPMIRKAQDLFGVGIREIKL